MQVPVEIEFQEMVASPAVQELVLNDMKKLEKRYGRATAGRIVVKGPGERHQTGGLYDVNIHLTLPNGREVNMAGQRRQTSGIQICCSPSTMRLSGRADNFRTMRGAWRER